MRIYYQHRGTVYASGRLRVGPRSWLVVSYTFNNRG